MHRTASVNEYSTRYSEAIDSMAKTAPDEWRLQSKRNKQGSTGVVEEWPEGYGHELMTPGEYLTNRESEAHGMLQFLYQERLKFGVAREVARKELPLSNYTEAYWQINLHNLLHFLALRMDPHAQLEIREFANAIGEIVAEWVPHTWQAFNDYHFRRNAVLFTAPEMHMLSRIFSEMHSMVGVDLVQYLQDATHGEPKTMSKREWEEFGKKLRGE